VLATYEGYVQNGKPMVFEPVRLPEQARIIITVLDESPQPNAMLRASFEEADAMLANPYMKSYATVEELNAAMDAEDAEEEIYV
jgi:hypothetical protein